MRCKLLVALQLEVPHHFIERFAVGAGVENRENALVRPIQLAGHTAFDSVVLFQARAQLTVSTSTLLVPPLVQPKSPVFPLGVSTLTFTTPGPEITSLESFTFNC
jgi:hypothetical protein